MWPSEAKRLSLSLGECGTLRCVRFLLVPRSWPEAHSLLRGAHRELVAGLGSVWGTPVGHVRGPHLPQAMRLSAVFYGGEREMHSAPPRTLEAHALSAPTLQEK